MRLPALASTAPNCRNSRRNQILDDLVKRALNYAVTNDAHIKSVAATTTGCAYLISYTSYCAFLTETICACYTQICKMKKVRAVMSADRFQVVSRKEELSKLATGG
jgi:hypothetical protein